MKPEYFVNPDSIVRKIWGKSDTVLFIFAGASAEFALNKAVDWLYFTGKLPADPIGRLFSTVSYARVIVFSEKESALRAIDSMTEIHAGVESKRGQQIPAWAYRDVLFMLIDYSIRAFEVLHRTLSNVEKNEVVKVFCEIGTRMGIQELPTTYTDFEQTRLSHVSQNLVRSTLTDDLFMQYRKHLGVIRYKILLDVQALLVPQRVRELLNFQKSLFPDFLLLLYKTSRATAADSLLRVLLLPDQYKNRIKELDTKPITPSFKFSH